MTDELLTWLEEIDLEEYHEAIRALGVKKTKYLKDVTEEGLTKINILPLEQRRFMENVKKTAVLTANAELDKNDNILHKSETINVKIPIAAFGMSRIKLKDQLIRTHGYLYYQTELTLKHKVTNGFVLNMCESAAWRFTTRSKLHKWAREERDRRWTLYLAFASLEELVNETEYYKSQSILYSLHKLKTNHKKICLMSQQKMHSFNEELSALLKMGEEGLKKICKYKDDTADQHGRKEESDFWTNLYIKAQRQLKELHNISEDLN